MTVITLDKQPAPRVCSAEENSSRVAAEYSSAFQKVLSMFSPLNSSGKLDSDDEYGWEGRESAC